MRCQSAKRHSGGPALLGSAAHGSGAIRRNTPNIAYQPAPELVRAVYQGLLEREPEAQGLEVWLGHLLGGGSVADMLREFARSDEYLAMAAERAGLKGGTQQAYLGNTPIYLGGDLIVAIDNDRVTNPQDISEIMDRHQAGDTVTVTFFRGSRKMTAKLQASGTRRPVLLRTSSSSGHGFGTALNEVIAQDTDVFAFIFDQLGVK